MTDAADQGRKRKTRKGKHPGGRPPYQPTEKDRRTVEGMTAMGATSDEVAQVLDIDPKTMRKYFRRELDTGRIVADSKVASNYYWLATQRAHPMAAEKAGRFWLMARQGWTPRTGIELGGIGGEAIRTENVTRLEDMDDASLAHAYHERIRSRG